MTDPISRKDSTESVKHVRTIQFSLMAICLALAAALTLDSSSYAKALSDLRKIHSFSNEWVENHKWLSNLALEHSAGLSDLESVDVFAEIHERHAAFNRIPSDWMNWKTYVRLEVDGKELVIALKMAHDGHWTIFQRQALALEVEAGRTALGQLIFDENTENEKPLVPQLRPPKTLQEFREFWEAANENIFLHRATVISTGEWKFLNAAGLSEQGVVYEIPREEPTHADLEITMALLPVRALGNGKEIPTEFGPITRAGEFVLINRQPVHVDGGTQIAYFVIPVLVDDHRIPIHSRMEQIANADGWGVGSTFAQSFRELDKLTTGLQDLEFEQIDRLLTNEARRIGESFQVFGVRFQVGLVNRIGLAAIFLVQLYLGVHFRELTRRLRTDLTDLAWEYPWIGLYKSKLSKFLLIASASILPTILSCSIGLRQWTSLGWGLESVVSITVCLYTVYLGFWISQIAKDLWQSESS